MLSQMLATPRNAQNSQKLLEKETLAETSNRFLPLQQDTGLARQSIGNTTRCSTKALAVNKATRISLACSFWFTR